MGVATERHSRWLSLVDSILMLGSAFLVLVPSHDRNNSSHSIPANASLGYVSLAPRGAMHPDLQPLRSPVLEAEPAPKSFARRRITKTGLPSSSQRMNLSRPTKAQRVQSHAFFEQNDGQENSQVLYLSRGSSYGLFLTHTGIAISLPVPRIRQANTGTRERRYFSIHFKNANPRAEVTGIDLLPGTSNYFSGSDPKLWYTRIPQFARVRYSNLYPGIDLIFYFRDGHLEYDVDASPGADPDAVNFQIEGARITLTREGDASIRKGADELVRLRKPYALQGGESANRVSVGYSLRQGSLFFALGRYNRSRSLTIDPALIFASFIASDCAGCSDDVTDLAADNTGVYLTGSTNAPIFLGAVTGPASGAPQSSTFVVKLDPTGSRVLYSAFLGGNGGGLSLAVDAVGAAYVSGTIGFPAPANSAFPLTAGAFSAAVPSNAVGRVAYAAKLSPDGSNILYSTLLQQPISSGSPTNAFQYVTPSKIAVDSNGALYVAGVAARNGDPKPNSIWMDLPVTVGAFQTTLGADFVLKLNPTASGLDYATYIDGISSGAVSASTPYVSGVAVDSTGDAFVSGATSSSSFPTTAGAYQPSNPAPGFNSAFVMKLNPDGTAPIYSTLFGSNSQAFGLAIDSNGRAVITGSADFSLPLTPNSFCGGPTNSFVGFVAKFTADGSGLVYSTSLCSSSQGVAVAVDSAGAADALGVTESPADFQPFLLNPIQAYPPVGTANIALKLDTSGNLEWSTFLGQGGLGLVEAGTPLPRIAVDGNGATYVLDASDIPPTPNSVGPPLAASSPTSFNFLLKIAPSLGAPVPLVSPRLLSFANQNVGTSSVPADVQVGNFGDAPVSPVVLITGDFSETDNCSTAVAGGQKCDINVLFTPSTTGPRTGTLTVSFGGNVPPQTVSLNGNAGAPAVTLSPASLSFPSQAIGTTSVAQQVTITNGGTGPLIISSLQTTDQFASTNTCGAPIAPSGDCTVQVTFTPTAGGAQSGTLTISDNAPNSPQNLALNGNVTTSASIGLGVAPGGSASVTVAAGKSATYALAIGGSGLSGTASVACTGAPTGATCSVPTAVPLSAATAATFNATVTTTARSNVWFIPTGTTIWLWSLAILGCLFLTAVMAQQSARIQWRLAPLLAVALCSCGGGSSPTMTPNGTPAGTYSITVTATSGSATQTQTLILTVQ
jgi:hypothetical protein